MRILMLVLLLCLMVPAHAQEKMLHAEYRVIVPGNAAASDREGQSRKVWRVGTKYLRFEDVPDPQTSVHGLIIVAEPDIWVIDRKSRQGRHSVDPGPDYGVHFPILAREPSSTLKALEFGNEVQFFRNNDAREKAPQTVDGVLCQVFQMRIDERDLTLFVREDGRPFQISVESGESQYLVRYLRYDISGEPDLSLFKPPTGIRISD